MILNLSFVVLFMNIIAWMKVSGRHSQTVSVMALFCKRSDGWTLIHE
jgi:hypothetical protein